MIMNCKHTHKLTQFRDGRLAAQVDSAAGEYLSHSRRCRVIYKGMCGQSDKADASSLLQPGPRRKVCYIYGSIPRRGRWYFFHCCQGYFNEIGPFVLVNGRDNGAISTLIWHAWHAAARHSEYDGEAEAQIG